MSERIGSTPAPTSPESAQSSPEEALDAEIEGSAQNLEAAVSTEDRDLNADANNIEDALGLDTQSEERPPMSQEGPLELTSEERGTKTRFEKLTELRIGIRERVTPLINNLEARMNTVQSKQDKFTKKALLLEYREGARQRKSTRLAIELSKATVGSRRHRRLMYKYGKANRKLGEMQTRISRLNGASDIRASEHERKEALREKEIGLRRDMLKVEKKVAQEKKIRRRMIKEAKETTNETHRDMLKREMAEWKSIGAFRQGLLKEAMRKSKEIEKRESL